MRTRYRIRVSSAVSPRLISPVCDPEFSQVTATAVIVVAPEVDEISSAEGMPFPVARFRGM